MTGSPSACATVSPTPVEFSTSAGIILAGTFSVLAIFAHRGVAREIGIVVAIGVLADTFLVRTILLPMLVADLGTRFWWPTRVPPTKNKQSQEGESLTGAASASQTRDRR